MPYTFCPPAREVIARYEADDRDTRNAKWRLFRHFDAGRRSVNVWKLTSGAYTETQPYDPSLVAIEYLGGHCHDVTSTEAAALIAAGYTVTETGGGATLDISAGYGGGAYAAAAYGG